MHNFLKKLRFGSVKYREPQGKIASPLKKAKDSPDKKGAFNEQQIKYSYPEKYEGFTYAESLNVVSLVG